MERTLVYEFWRLLNGEERQEASLDDVKVALGAVLRMRVQHSRGEEEAEGEEQTE